ncbi:MAG TPA: hypothetical protein VF692_11935, partial [Pyrinomonadaceae bacterium]
NLEKKVRKYVEEFTRMVIEAIEELGISESVPLLEDLSKLLENDKAIKENRFMKGQLLFLYKTKYNVLNSLKDFHKANLENDKAIKLLEGFPEHKIIIEQTIDSYVKRLIHLLDENLIQESSITINKIISALKKIDDNNWLMNLCGLFMAIIKEFGDEKAEKIFNLSNLKEELFPVTLALHYLQTKDEMLIEKLSPEVRVVVEEVIKTLQMNLEEKPESKLNQKVKNKKDRKSENSKSLSLSK